MKDAAALLNRMRQAGVILDYAVFGAIAQMRYTEAVATVDVDVLVAVPEPDRLDLLGPIYQFYRESGYEPDGEAVRVGAWPVQFVPVFNAITEHALANAEAADFEGAELRVVSAAYLAVIALSVGRAKGIARVVALLESGAVSRNEVAEVAEREGIADRWHWFAARFVDDGP